MWRRVGLALSAVAVSAIALSSCSGGSGLGLARQACGRVHSSIVAYDDGIHAAGRATRVRDLRTANDDLQAAEPLAAAATSANGQWNALMTTLNEVGQVDEGHLISALQAQCAVANSGDPDLPGAPSGRAGSTTTVPW